MAYTAEQHEAIYMHDRNLIVTAGAGSGKTRVLVDRFIAILEANPDWPLPSLVAITFTEKAAREMRDRVRQAIERQIAQAVNNSNDAAIRRWRDHQAALDSARIGTIHGLCTSILRANAAYVGIDPAFEVMDEIESIIVRGDAVDQALAQVDAYTAELLATYDVGTIQKVLRSMISLPEDQLPSEADFFTEWQAAYHNFVQETLTELREDIAFVAAICWEPSGGWPVDNTDRMLQNWQLIFDGRDVMLNGASAENKLRILRDWADGISLVGGSSKLWGKEKFDTAKQHAKLIRERAKDTIEQIGQFGELDSTAAALLPAWGGALRTAKAIYQDMKARRRVLDFDDLEAMTRRLLRNPEVGSRYRDREFRHVLIDEFQDTNSAQREIVAALVDMQRAGSLFVVGDPRQSIYAFRGADVSVFSEVSSEILSLGGREVALTQSFRTHRKLVDGFNTVFSALMVKRDGPTGKYQVQLGTPMMAYRDTQDGPCLELILVDKAYAAEGSNIDDLRRWEATTLATRLLELIASGAQVWDKEDESYRTVGFGDMAVLFQSRKMMPIVEEAFKAANIPYVTVGGKGYYSRPEVWDLLNLLKALYNTSDDLALASALRSPLYNLSDDDLLALRLQRGQKDSAGYSERLTLWTALMDADRTYDPALPDAQQVTFARESLRRLSGIAGRVTIAELLIRVLEETAYLATLSGLSDGARRCGNVEKLIEVARRSGRVALGEFTLYLDDLTTIEAREGEAVVAAENAVQLMTVHASKGLEFSVVALFDASWENKSRDEWVVVDPIVGPACCVRAEDGKRSEPFAYRLAKRYAKEREDAEHIRLLYVAMTRAQDYVIVSGQINSEAKTDAKKSSVNWLNLLINTLGLPKTLDNDEAQIISMMWGDCLLRIPRRLEDKRVTFDSEISVDALPSKQPREKRQSAWDQLNNLDGQPIPGVRASEPPMLTAAPVDPHAASRMLTATEIAVLGEAKATGKLGRFRHHVLRDAPPSVREVASETQELKVSRRVIGDIVHQALRWGHFPGETVNLRDILDSYAWEQGVTDPQMIEEAITEATDLLERTERSSIVGQIREAQQVYRELPFMFQLGERTINGVIDVLFFSKYGKWHIVDYKTSAVPINEDEDRGTAIREHAERYHAQVGI
jgi:ATP-dependent helicase/nuclease subunit A